MVDPLVLLWRDCKQVSPLVLSCSRQRHNKLWRSHSDSDLSDHHEPLSKSYAQPHSLGHSDPHGQTGGGGAAGPSVKELLESLGSSSTAGKPSHSTSQPDTGVQAKPLRSSSSVGAADAPGLRAPPPSAPIQIRPGRSESTAGSEPQASPRLSNGVCDPAEEPSPPLSQPRAATVVQRTDSVTVAQSVLVGQPHPPPSFHRLPSPPPPSCTDQVGRAKQASVPEPATATAPQARAPCPSAPVPVRRPDGEPQPSSSPPARPASTSDLISHPSAIPQSSQVLFGHAADHINFFSAREKFKGMSQDGRSCQSRSGGKEQQAPPPEGCTSEGKEEEKGKVEKLILVGFWCVSVFIFRACLKCIESSIRLGLVQFSRFSTLV